jgi:hypothetical protein
LKILEYFKYSNKNKELLIGKAPAMTSIQIEDFSTNFAPSIGFFHYIPPPLNSPKNQPIFN